MLQHRFQKEGRVINTSPQVVVAVLLLGVGLVGPTSPAKAGMISFQEDVSPTTGYKADATFVWRSKPTEVLNNTRPDELIVGSLQADEPPGDHVRPLLEFDLSEIDTQADGQPLTIDSVQLVMNTLKIGYKSIAVDVRQYGYNLIEESSTWNNPDGGGLDGTPGGTLGTFLTNVAIPQAAGVDVVFSDTVAFRAAVSDALGSVDHTLRLILVDDDESLDAKTAYFCSNEYSTTDRRPELIVSFTVGQQVIPEPTSLALLGLGVVGLLAWRWRRRR